MHRLGPHGVPFLELEGPVVHAAGQAEAVFGQGGLAAPVALVHGPDLGNGGVALVHEQQGVVGDIFEEGRRRLARQAAGEVTAVVLDAGARAGALDHLQVEHGPLFQALGLQQLAVLHHPFQPLLKLLADVPGGLEQGGAGGDVVAVGVDADGGQVGGLLAGEGVELGDGLDLVAEQADPPGAILVVGGEDLQGVAALAEGPALEGGVIALVLLGDEIGEQLLLVHPVAHRQVEGHGGVGFHRADAVDAGHRGHDDDVVSLQHRSGGRVAHPVDLLVDRAVLLYVGVRPWDVGLGLIVVVVADEILDRIVGEEAPELAVELGGQGLVMGQDQGRALGLLDDLRHGEGLARAGDPQQHLVLVPPGEALAQLGDGVGLVPGRGVVADQLEPAPALRLVRSGRAVGSPQGRGEVGEVSHEGRRHLCDALAGGRRRGRTRHERKVGPRRADG